MKLIYYILLFLFFNLQSAAQDVQIKLHLQNFDDKELYLAVYQGDQFKMIDTFNLVKFKAKLTYDQPLNEGVYVIAGDNKAKYFDFIIADDQIFNLRTHKDAIIDSLQIKGASQSEAFVRYQKYSNLKNKQYQLAKKMANILNGPKQLEAVKEQNQIQEDLLRYRMNYVLKNPDIFLGKLYNSMIEITIPEELKGLPQKRYDYYLDHFWDNVDLEDERLLRSPVLASKTNNYFDKVSVQHSEAINASIDKLLSRKIHPEIQKYFLIKLSLKYEHPNVMGLDACFVHLSDNYLKSDEILSESVRNALIERANVLKPLLIGSKAPEMLLIDTTGNFISNYNLDNKYTLLVFWAHDCDLCKKELRLLNAIGKNNTFDMGIYAIETTNNYDAWKNYIIEKDYQWTHVNGTKSMTNDFHTLYNIYTTPTIYILNQKKEIIAKQIGVKNITMFLQNYEKSLKNSN